jgi:hypothetical protein
MLAVARSPRRGEYLVVQFGSGSFYRTDRLGAVVSKALIAGRSDLEVVELAESSEPGAGERARRLLYVLEAKGAIAPVPPPHGTRRWQRRVIAAIAGLAVTACGIAVALTPNAILARGFSALLSSPIAGSGGDGAAAAAGSARPRRSFNYLFNYLSLCLSQPRLGRMINRLFDPIAADAVAGRIRDEGATVGVFLHGPLCPAVPNVLRSRACEVVRVVAPMTHGINVSPRSGSLRAFFGEPDEMLVTDSARLAIGPLLRHLKSGHSVYVALDNIIHNVDTTTGEMSKPAHAAEIEMLGLRFPRNDMPAWLAVRSGRPAVLWTTRASDAGFVLSASPAIYPNADLPVEQRVKDVSRQLYRYAEAAILDHPQDWRYWPHIAMMTVDAPGSP